MNRKDKNLHVLELLSSNIQAFAETLRFGRYATDRLQCAVVDTETAYSLLEEAAEEIKKLQGADTLLTQRIRELLY